MTAPISVDDVAQWIAGHHADGCGTSIATG